MKLLTVAISTVKKEKINVLKKINCLSGGIKNLLDFLVISQFEDRDEIYLDGDVRVITMNSKGLSKSRNVAIKETRTEWVWFQDDDFLINETQLAYFLDSFLADNTRNTDIALVRIGSLENREKYYKSYGDYSKFSRLLSLKVSSIEIIAKVSFIKENGIKFDERLGLGTDLPCCEENQFMLDSFDSGAQISFLNKVMCYHTTLPENRKIDYFKNLQAKGFFLKNFSLLIAFILILKWSFSIKSNFSYSKNFQLLMKGLFSKIGS